MSRKGFTLVEVAAATVVLALLVIPLLGARNRTVASAIESSRKLVVAQLAASKLSELASVPLDEIESSGNFEDAPGCAWSFSVEPAESGEGDDDFEEIVEEVLEPHLYRVTLTIRYPAPSKAGEIGTTTVSTLVFKRESEEEEE